MSTVRWQNSLLNIATLPGGFTIPIDITINNRSFKTNLTFLIAISNKVKNLLYLKKSTDSFTFNCCIKDPETYNVLKEFFRGQQIGNDYRTSICEDLFELALAIECPDLIEYFYDKFELSNYSLENFDQNIIYCRYCDTKDEFIEFVSQNIQNIGVSKLVQTCNTLGYDFAERIIKYCVKNSIDINDFVSSLIESNPLFFDLLLLIDSSKLNLDSKLRINQCYLNPKVVKYESISEYIYSYMPTVKHETENMKMQIEQLTKLAESYKLQINETQQNLLPYKIIYFCLIITCLNQISYLSSRFNLFFIKLISMVKEIIKKIRKFIFCLCH